MQVRDLIEILQRQNPCSPVRIEAHEGQDTFGIEIAGVESHPSELHSVTLIPDERLKVATFGFRL